MAPYFALGVHYDHRKSLKYSNKDWFALAKFVLKATLKYADVGSDLALGIGIMQQTNFNTNNFRFWMAVTILALGGIDFLLVGVKIVSPMSNHIKVSYFFLICFYFSVFLFFFFAFYFLFILCFESDLPGVFHTCVT